jgi:hypothetical protein
MPKWGLFYPSIIADESFGSRALQIKLEEVGESFYQSMMKDMVKYLGDKGLLVDDEGRKVLVVWVGEGGPKFFCARVLEKCGHPCFTFTLVIGALVGSE